MSYLLCVRKIVGEKLSILLPAILNSGKKKIKSIVIQTVLTYQMKPEQTVN